MNTDDFEAKFRLLGFYDKVAQETDALPFNDQPDPKDLLSGWLLKMGVSTRVTFLSYLLVRWNEGGIDAIGQARFDNEVYSYDDEPIGHLNAVFARLRSLFGEVVPQALAVAQATLEGLQPPDDALVKLAEKHANSPLNSQPPEPTLGTKEAAAYLDVAVNTLSKYVAKGVLTPVVRHGSRLNLFYVSDLDTYKATAKPKNRIQKEDEVKAKSFDIQVEAPGFISRKRKAKRI